MTVSGWPRRWLRRPSTSLTSCAPPRPSTSWSRWSAASASGPPGLQIGILVEFMPEGSIPDFATAAAVVAGLDKGSCAVMLDTWHFFRTAGTLDQLRNLAPGTIGAVQVSDGAADLFGSGVEPPTRDRLVPGDGVIPLQEILALAMANFPPVMVGAEVFSRALAAEAPVDRARRVRAGLDAVWPM